MKEITVDGKTVEEAIESALQKLNTTSDRVDVEVIEEPKKGILGIGRKSAIIKVRKKPDPVETAVDYLKTITQEMGLSVTVSAEQTGASTYQLDMAGEQMGILIGKRGQTLNAVQYLVNLVANQASDKSIRIMLDAEDYRARRTESLQRLAERMAKKVMKTNKAIKLEPMPNFERKIIHSALQSFKQVQTHSTGEEPKRAIVIEPKS